MLKDLLHLTNLRRRRANKLSSFFVSKNFPGGIFRQMFVFFTTPIMKEIDHINNKKEETIMMLLLGISLMTIIVVMDYYEVKEKKEKYESYLARK